jgi:hypothetical protein
MLFRATVERPVQDVDTSTDALDWPVEWHNAIVYNFAVYADFVNRQVSPHRMAGIRQDAQRYLDEVKRFDTDPGFIRFRPHRRR